MVRQLRFIVAIGLVLAAGLFAAGKEGPTADKALWQQATTIFAPLPTVAQNPDNPLSTAKVELGKRLYFDKRLSKEGSISCDSCHVLATFGVDNMATSPGDTGELGTRNSPTVLNAALHVAQFWDGRAPDVEAQAGMPITNPIEMAIPSEEFLVDRLAAVPGYAELFAAAFPDDDPALTYQNVRRALAAFERTLLTPSRFDDYLRGDLDVLTALEKEGLETFVGLGCSSCHNGVNVGGHIFRKFGLGQGYWYHTKSARIDEGRYAETGREEDRYVFKVSSLRNVEMTYPYFHDGSVDDLEEAIRVMARVQVSWEPEDAQVKSIEAFLKTLTGELPETVTSPPAAFENPSP